MASTQMNIRTSPVLLDEIDVIVQSGMFRNRTEAVNEALRLLIRKYRIMKIADQIKEFSEDNKVKKNLTRILLEAREEDDS
jgi:Arc/MetJ-type ribon-helix-helix transcriptional regulator